MLVPQAQETVEMWRRKYKYYTTLTSFFGGPPAGDPRLAAGGEVVGGGGQTDGPDVLVEGDVGVQLHQGNVVVVVEVVVAVVNDDAPHVPPHRPLVVPTLHVQAQKGLPLAGVGVPALMHTGQSEASGAE